MHPARAKRVRDFLQSNRGEDETTCQTAARLGIFCRGYQRWTTEELRGQYPWLAKRLPPDVSREELLKLIVAWDGARMLAQKAPTTCDAKGMDHDGCLGFDQFNNEALKRLFPQLFQREDEITPY